MDDFVSIMAELQRVLSVLQMVEIKSTQDNLKYMLACQNSIEDVKRALVELHKRIREKEEDPDE